MYFPFRERPEKALDLLLLSPPMGRGSVLPGSPSAAPPSSWADEVTYKSRGVVIADGLGIAKCCGNEGVENERVAAPERVS